MDDFKKNIKRKRLGNFIWVLIIIIPYFISNYLAAEVFQPEHPVHSPGTINWAFVSGLFFGLIIAIGIDFIKIRNPERLRKMYIEENDERERFISLKAKAATLRAIMIGSGIGIAVSVNFSETAFITIISVFAFVTAAKLITHAYYRKKY